MYQILADKELCHLEQEGSQFYRIIDSERLFADMLFECDPFYMAHQIVAVGTVSGYGSFGEEACLEPFGCPDLLDIEVEDLLILQTLIGGELEDILQSPFLYQPGALILYQGLDQVVAVDSPFL